MSKYKLRWMQDFEIINMDFDNLGLAIKLLLTLDDSATLTVTNPTGSIHGYRMSSDKIELMTADNFGHDVLTIREDHNPSAVITWATTSTSPLTFSHPEPAVQENLGDMVEKYRSKINKMTGITPQAVLDDKASVSTSDIVDQIRNRQKLAAPSITAPTTWMSMRNSDAYTRAVLSTTPTSLFANLTA